MLGHSLGGVNAYQYAARHADRVSALIVEDIGAVVDSDWSFTLRLPRQTPSRQELVSALGPVAVYLECCFRRAGDCWGVLLLCRGHGGVAEGTERRALAGLGSGGLPHPADPGNQ